MTWNLVAQISTLMLVATLCIAVLYAAGKPYKDQDKPGTDA